MKTESPVFDDSNDLERRTSREINKDRSRAGVDARIITPVDSMKNSTNIVDGMEITRTTSNTEETVVRESQDSSLETKECSKVIHNEATEEMNRKVPNPNPCGISKANINELELNGISSDSKNDLPNGHKDGSICCDNTRGVVDTHAQYEDLPSPISPVDIKVEDFSARFGDDDKKDRTAESLISAEETDEGSQLNHQSRNEVEQSPDIACKADPQTVVFKEQEIENENDDDTEATLEMMTTEISVGAIELDAANDLENHDIDVKKLGSMTADVNAASEKELRLDPEVDNDASAAKVDGGDFTAMIVDNRDPEEKCVNSITIAPSGIEDIDKEEKPKIAFLEITNADSENQQAEVRSFTFISDSGSAEIKSKDDRKRVLTSTVAGLTESASKDGAITFRIGKPTARSGIKELTKVKSDGSQAYPPEKTDLRASDSKVKESAQNLQDGEGSLIDAGQMKFKIGMPNSNSGNKSTVKLDDNSYQTCYINEVGMGSGDEDLVVIELGNY